MSGPPPPPGRRDPLARTRQPVPLPAARSRAALGLAVAAAEGTFALQVCQECRAVQYPPRDVCWSCLSDRLRREPVPNTGRLLAVTTTRTPGERYFRERAPWRTGLVKLDIGPIVLVHLHGDCIVDAPVRLELKLDSAGRGAVFASPADPQPPGKEDRQLRELTADPKHRRVLIADGRASTTPALARTLAEAGASRIFVGVAERWKPFPAGDALAGLAAVEIVTLDVTDTTSVQDLAGQIGDKIDILVNNVGHVRPGGLVAGQGPVLARETYEVCCLGLVRLAKAFGPVMRARAADDLQSASAFVNIISAWSLAAPAEWGAYGAAQAAVRALSQALRQEMRASGLSVVDVLTGPLEDEWHQVLPPPKVRPEALAAALVAALRGGREEVVVGDVAREIHARWAEDPRLLRQEGS